MRKVDVTFTGQVVLPVLHKAEVMDISVKAIEITRTGKDGLICRDNIRADIRITFFVKVNKTVEDVIKVAQAVGTARASDRDTLQGLFHAKFSEARLCSAQSVPTVRSGPAPCAPLCGCRPRSSARPWRVAATTTRSWGRRTYPG